jgi:hypothetical protein
MLCRVYAKRFHSKVTGYLEEYGPRLVVKLIQQYDQHLFPAKYLKASRYL